MKKSIIGLALASLLISHVSLASVPEAHEFRSDNIFNTNNVISMLNNAHPRLLAKASDFDSIKQKMNTNQDMKLLVSEIIRRADESLKKETITFHLTGNDASPSLLDTSRKAIDIILNNAFAWHITHDNKYAKKAIDTMLAIAEFPDWNAKSRYLDAGEMMFAQAIGYDWLYAKLDPEQEQTIRDSLLTDGINWGMKAYQDNDPQASSLGFPWWATNWNEVCNGGTLAAILATAEFWPEKSAALLNNIIPSLKMGLDAYKPDGASAEGPVYWSYGMTYRVIAQEMLSTAFNNDFGLSDDPVLSKTAWYRYAIEGTTGNGFNYGDGVEDQGYTPAWAWLGKRFNQPAIINASNAQMQQAIQRSQSKKPWGEFDRFLPLYALWFPESLSTESNNTPETFIFHGPSELFVYKKEQPTSIYLGVKSGTNKANHAHQDLGSFIFELDNIRWASDLGKDYYNLPGYFDNKVRPTYFRISALSHNTITFDDRNQSPEGTATLTTSGDKSIIVDLTNAYPGIAHKITRNFKILDDRNIKITDEIEKSNSQHEYRWAMVTTARVSIDKNKATLTKDGKTLLITANKDASFIESSTNPGDDQQKKNDGTTMLAIKHMIAPNTNYKLSVTFSK
ncbi:MAG: heparinase II/III domain-containing protein [Hafnia alvei]